MILTDGTHMVSDTSVSELHFYARRLGMKRSWFQNHRIPHYDLLGNVAMHVPRDSPDIEMVTSRQIVKRAARA